MDLMDRFFTGINYWDSQNAVYMWRRFDETIIDEDLSKLESCGFSVLRVFPLWEDFQPLSAMYSPQGVYEYGLKGDHLPDTPAGQAGVDEEMCRRFEVFCDLACKHHMKLIVAPLTGQMSFGMFVPPAFQGKNPIKDASVIKWEIRYLTYFVTRFKDHPAIAAWNPGNEINFMAPAGSITADEFFVWCSTVSNVIRVCDPRHPVISAAPSPRVASGVSSFKDAGELFDIHVVHTYNIFDTPRDKVNAMRSILDTTFRCRLSEGIAQKPTFPEEFGATGYQNCSFKEEADYYRASFHSLLANGFHGLMWWCAFDQGHLTCVPYDWNNIGSDYGFFDKNGNEKPIAREQKRLAEWLSSLPELPACSTDSVILIPRDDVNDIMPNAQTTFVLCKQAGLNPRFAYALDPLPDSPLYMLPSVSGIKAITNRRLDDLLEKAEAGATLYLSLDRALFRRIEEITGVRFHSREEKTVRRTVRFGGETLTVSQTVCHGVEAVDADILAYDDAGEPVYFKKELGKGAVYFSLLPIEHYLSGQSGVFENGACANYAVWYQTFAQDILNRKTVRSDSPYICLTEHFTQNGDLYVYAVNYSTAEETARISVQDGFTATCLHGNDTVSGALTLAPAEASVFFLRR